MPLNRQSRAKGFTLIELMLTLAVLAILSLLAMPAFQVWVANSRVRAVGSGLTDGLRLAQTEALRRSRQTVFALTTNANPAAASVSGPPGYSVAVANGGAAVILGNAANPVWNWAVSVVPVAGVAASDANGVGAFVQSGNGQGAEVSGPAALCFNAAGRLVSVASTATGVDATCAVPAPQAAQTAPPVAIYQITTANASAPLQVEVGLGGQVRLCNPNYQLPLTGASAAAPGVAAEGCQSPMPALNPTL